MATELKPCPFCGYQPVFDVVLVRKGYEGDIQCNACPANIHTITFDSLEEAERAAIEAWNRRAEEC